MTITQALTYGIVQGLTEYLPVSSSAHLLLVPFFTGWPDPGLAFDVALHWGTLVAVVIYFWRDLLVLTKGAFGSLAGGRTPENLLPWRIALATVPGAIAGVLLEHRAETTFRSPWIPAVMLPVLGIFLALADRFGRKSVRMETMPWSSALIIGLCQALALIPGVSRSGITITSALFLGLERQDAVRFSFLISVPIIAGAGILKIHYLVGNVGDPAVLTSIAASAISGLLAIHVLITYVRTRTFMPFVVYRFLLGATVAFFLLRSVH